MKKYLTFFKIGGGILLSVYSVLFSIYLFIVGFLLGAIMFGNATYSGSSLEDSLRWFFQHPIVFFICIVMIIPGILIMGWDDIVKKINKQREKRNELFLKSYR
jgi:heme/copper-type cytochrome/quinol oxidase subunit 1